MDVKNYSNIAILGFGREGQSTYRFIRTRYPEKKLTIADVNADIAQLDFLQQDINLDYKLGKNYLENLSDFDLIIKSPGISLKKNPALSNDQRLSSQTDLFLQDYASKVVGITGTKGKSTTTALIYHILKKQSEDVLLAGNIGIPPFDIIEQINDNTKIIFEMSSHQLQDIKTSPHIAVLLNIFQEHLDHYTSYNAYQQAKWNITRFQNAEDYFIYNFDQALLKGFLSSSKIKRQFYPYSLKNKVEQGCYVDDGKLFFNRTQVYDCSEERYLKGEHNILNMMAAVSVCKLLNIPDKIIREGLTDFKGLPHRMEHIGTYRGIHFYNDSISTIPEAAMAALKALKHVQTLILGGYDRGIDYSILIDFLIENPVENIIFVGEAGKRMRNLWIHEIVSNPQIQNDFVNFFDAKDYENIVKLAYQLTDDGQICLLSPAASSYDSFKNFEHRGNYFRELVELYK